MAKLIGLRVIAVADVVRHGARLSELGVDVLVDRQDTSRAIDIIRGVTKGDLRFALDTVGKETATHLQEGLHQSKDERQGHLVVLTGLPKVRLPGVKYHSLPIKLFHCVEAVGEKAMDWLEKLLLDKILTPPAIVTAAGGLEGVNGALDKLRSGAISGKRLVVPIETGNPEDSFGQGDKSERNDGKAAVDNLEYADKLNEEPSRIKFA